MHIHQLRLERFRGASSLSLVLDSRLNVFVGMNGAGKSSVLDATAILLSWLANRVRHAGASGRPIKELDIRNNESGAVLSLTVGTLSRDYGWSLAKSRKGRSQDERSSLGEVTNLAKILEKRINATNGEVDLPLLAYYPINRAVLDIPLRIRSKHSFDVVSAYDDSLISGASFRTFFEWFREREDLENENLKYRDQLIRPDDFQFPDRQLEAVRQALEQFMPDFTNLTVRRNPLRMEVDKQGQKLTVNQLSDGEKCLMAMVGDLARRFAIANPMRGNPLEGQGVVLIDEIDLHLHPKWQRMVVPRLLEVFPNCQFLISTHSPHVITHVQPENLFLLQLREGQLSCSRPAESYGKTVERVLEDLMGIETTRPDEVNNSLRHIFELIDQRDFDDARVSIEQLEQEIGQDPELTKAGVLIKRKELIGK
ncbi:ATPase [Lamprobacter modestohalophilus]|uniref:ATPase n=1 Tax=Lamprobacter modestohalophilus TaxID=1064514 RepID=A0A9X0WED3_9GAMM|nr:AAA family ATPase [Lamprobacter modestohalophilus]MBK1621483.1 ATPase [Lamprobacter modestohalophilus]